MEAFRPGIITVTCKKCSTKRIVYRNEYDEHEHMVRGYLVCESCSHILLPKKYEGKKVSDI